MKLLHKFIWTFSGHLFHRTSILPFSATGFYEQPHGSVRDAFVPVDIKGQMYKQIKPVIKLIKETNLFYELAANELNRFGEHNFFSNSKGESFNRPTDRVPYSMIQNNIYQKGEKKCSNAQSHLYLINRFSCLLVILVRKC